MKQLTAKSDLRGLLQCMGLLLAIAATGTLAYTSWYHLPIPVTVLAFWLHGTVATFASPNAAVHELCHRTPFRSRWLNDLFLNLFGFISWTNPVWFRTSHMEHHQHTLHPPADSEVVLPQRVNKWALVKALTVDPRGIYHVVRGQVRTALGKLDGPWAHHIFPEEEPELRRRLFNWSRFCVLGHIVLAGVFIATGQWPLLLIVVLPIYATWLGMLCGLPQHIGLIYNVDDYRRCCRTVLQGPITRFLYWNMNYHIEHHMYASVPFFNLPRLHKLVQDDGGPTPCRGLWKAWLEIAAIQRAQDEQAEIGYDTFSRGGEMRYVLADGGGPLNPQPARAAE